MLLDSIRNQHFHDLEVLVVDNGSIENPHDFLEQHYPEVHFIRSEKNLGFAGGNNLALPQARGEFFFFVNNDAELTPDCISILVQRCKNNPKIGLLSPLICYSPMEKWTQDKIQYAGMTRVHPLTGRNRTIGQGEWNAGQFSKAHPVAYAHGAAMMAPRAVLEMVGPMDEQFFLYYEELDWAEKIKKAGWEVWIEPLAIVYHAESLTMNPLAPIKTFYLNRNRIWFMERHSNPLQRLFFYTFLWLAVVPKNTLLFLLRGEFGQLRAFWSAILGKPWPIS
jgi:GT2 family glycosyltransferase